MSESAAIGSCQPTAPTLLAAGASEHKVLRVVGLAASVPLIEQDPFDARNRRISVIVMNKLAEQAITHPGAAIPRPASST